MCSERACLRLPAATRTATTFTSCAPIPPSSSPAEGFPIRARTLFPANRFSPGERAHAERDHPAYLCADRYLAQELQEAARLGGAGHRRYARYRARPPETGGMERPLRRALLSADPHLRHGDRPSGGGDPAPRQDAIGPG